VHKSGWVRNLIEQRGCQLWLLPSYSPDFNPIEEAFSKVKNLIRKARARTLEALFAVTARVLEAISKEDARGFFADCGYDASRDHSLFFLMLRRPPRTVQETVREPSSREGRLQDRPTEPRGQSYEMGKMTQRELKKFVVAGRRGRSVA